MATKSIKWFDDVIWLGFDVISEYKGRLHSVGPIRNKDPKSRQESHFGTPVEMEVRAMSFLTIWDRGFVVYM